MAAAHLTGDRLAFTGDVKRKAKWAQGQKAFVFKNKIWGITFKCFPSRFNTTFGQEIGYRTYFFAFCAFMNIPGAPSGNSG